MKKLKNRKLSLHRETLRTLAAESLQQVAGGDQSISSSWMPPPSYTCTMQISICGECTYTQPTVPQPW